MYSCSKNPLPASHNTLMSRGVIYIMNSCVHAWCNIWGAHPAVSRAQSTDSLSLCLSIFPSVHLTAVCIQCHTAAAAAAAAVGWYKRVGGTASSVFPQKNEQTSYWSSCWRGGFGFQSPALHNLFPQLGQIKKTKERSTGRGEGLGAEGIYMYVSIKEKTRKSHGEVKEVWKKTDYKKKKDGRGLSTRTWREEGAGAGNWR